MGKRGAPLGNYREEELSRWKAERLERHWVAKERALAERHWVVEEKALAKEAREVLGGRG
jgi:hypothetical protein